MQPLVSPRKNKVKNMVDQNTISYHCTASFTLIPKIFCSKEDAREQKCYKAFVKSSTYRAVQISIKSKIISYKIIKYFVKNRIIS